MPWRRDRLPILILLPGESPLHRIECLGLASSLSTLVPCDIQSLSVASARTWPCTHLATLNYISQNPPFPVLPVSSAQRRFSHSWRTEGGSHFVTHTHFPICWSIFLAWSSNVTCNCSSTYPALSWKLLSGSLTLGSAVLDEGPWPLQDTRYLGERHQDPTWVSQSSCPWGSSLLMTFLPNHQLGALDSIAIDMETTLQRLLTEPPWVH